MALSKTLVTMKPSMFDYPKAFGKCNILSLFFNGKFVDGGKNLVTPSGVTWSCGNISPSLNAIFFC